MMPFPSARSCGLCSSRDARRQRRALHGQGLRWSWRRLGDDRGGRKITSISAAFGFDRHLVRFGQGRRLGRHGGLESRCLLGLERLQGPERAPELGERAAAIAQERVEGSGVVAIADQGEPEAAAGKVVLGEQLGLELLGAGETPGSGDDPLREHGLQRALGRQFLHQRRLECGKLGSALARQYDVLLRTQTVLEGVLGRAHLALGRLGAARLRTIAAAGLGAGGAERDGRAQRGADT
jgi:hypothetical protein